MMTAAAWVAGILAMSVVAGLLLAGWLGRVTDLNDRLGDPWSE